MILTTETSHHQMKMLHWARNGWLLPRKEAEATRRARGRTSPALVRLGAGVSPQQELYTDDCYSLEADRYPKTFLVGIFHARILSPPAHHSATSGTSKTRAAPRALNCHTRHLQNSSSAFWVKDLLPWVSPASGRCACWWISCLFAKSELILIFHSPLSRAGHILPQKHILPPTQSSSLRYPCGMIREDAGGAGYLCLNFLPWNLNQITCWLKSEGTLLAMRIQCPFF